MRITISEQAYQALVNAAAARSVTPEDIILAGIQALDDHRVTTAEPMTADEFAAALGMTPEDVARADEEARRRYPDAFTHEQRP